MPQVPALSLAVLNGRLHYTNVPKVKYDNALCGTWQRYKSSLRGAANVPRPDWVSYSEIRGKNCLIIKVPLKRKVAHCDGCNKKKLCIIYVPTTKRNLFKTPPKVFFCEKCNSYLKYH